jgi:hypothetical protein
MLLIGNPPFNILRFPIRQCRAQRMLQGASKNPQPFVSNREAMGAK